MPSETELRLLGVSLADVSDYRVASPSGKWSQFFGALADRYELIDVIRPVLSRRDHYLGVARAVHPRPTRWRARSSFGPARFHERTAAVQAGLDGQDRPYDLIMQMQTLCAPGFDRRGVPYAIYTDNTMALTQRFYPPGARLSARAARRWMDLEAAVCQGATAVFTLSEFARDSMINDYGCPPDQVVAVGAGTNQFLAELPPQQPDMARALFVGTEFTRKGGKVLLDAWRTVNQQIPEAELVIAGPRANPVRADDRGVRWVGRVNRETLASLYESSSLFVMPSLFEPWGFVFFEAMGHGLPCVGAAHCAMDEIIDDGTTGRLVAPGESEPLAAVLTEMLSDPVRTAVLGRAAHAQVIAGNAWSDVIDRVAAHLGDQRDQFAMSRGATHYAR